MTGKGIAGFIVVLALAGSSAAAPITWSFEGQVGAIGGASPATLATLSSLGVSPGSAFSGQLVFESTTADSNPVSVFGNYLEAISSLDVTIGSLHPAVVAGDPYNQMIVNTTDGLIRATGYGSGSSSIFDSPILEIDLLAATPGQISSDSLPLFPPDLASLQPFSLGSPINGYGTGIAVFGSDANLFLELTHLVRVPEPGVAALIGLTLAAGGTLKSRRSRASSRSSARVRVKRIAGFIVALALAGSGAAAPITWRFEGQVRAIQDASPDTLAALSSLGASPGSAFSGRFVFESATADLDGTLELGHYQGAISTFDLTVGSFHPQVVSGDPYNQIVVDLSSGVIRGIGYGPGSDSVFTSPILQFDLLAMTPGQFASDALPLFPPPLTSLQPFDLANPVNRYGTGIAVGAQDALVFMELTSLVRVPEPGVAGLIGLSLAALLKRRSA